MPDKAMKRRIVQSMLVAISVLACGWLLLFARPYPWAIGSVFFMAIAIGVLPAVAKSHFCWGNTDRFKSKLIDISPFAVCIAGAAFWRTSSDTQIVNEWQLALTAGLCGIALGCLTARPRKAESVAIAACTWFLLAYSLFVQTAVHAQPSTTQELVGTVTKKYTSQRPVIRHIVLSTPQGDLHLNVPVESYERHRTGDMACAEERVSWFGVRYLTEIGCDQREGFTPSR